MKDRLFLDELVDGSPFTHPEVAILTQSLLLLLQPLHARQQCHKQIGPHTLWIEADCDESANLHLCDPGECHPSHRRCVCRPPGSDDEDHVWSTRDDVWQVGYTMLQLLMGKTCHRCIDTPRSLLADDGELPILPAGLSLDCIDFLMDCLHPDPSERPSVGELLDHSFLSCSDGGIDDVMISMSSMQLQNTERKPEGRCRPLAVKALRSTKHVKFVSPSHTARCRECLKCDVDVEEFRSSKLCLCACDGSDLSPKSAAPTKRQSSGHNWDEPEVLKRIRLMDQNPV
mmetsp:Transcript_35989/g.112531  ORF Transcript_35989/g.112531 Transcript_35989/m.112531 type:complete len:286 (-) Transcript_35989:153-1010(-)